MPFLPPAGAVSIWVPARPCPVRNRGPAARFKGVAIGWLLFGMLGCWEGGPDSGRDTVAAPSVGTVIPNDASVVVGEALTFTVQAPAGTEVRWSVAPAGAGTINANGTFTAGQEPAVCTIAAAWSVAGASGQTSATLYVVDPPVAATLNPGYVLASGGAQRGIDYQNFIAIGVRAGGHTARSADGSLKTRSGLDWTDSGNGF